MSLAHEPGRGQLRVEVTDTLGRPLKVPGLAGWLARVAPARARGRVTIGLVTDRDMQALNRRYRGIDSTTDVLSFSASDRATPTRISPAHLAPRTRQPVPGTRDPTAPSWHLGDVAISLDMARRQAKEARHSVGVELRVLALHGLLHLLGYDHERDGGRMARLERRLRQRGGLSADRKLSSLKEKGKRKKVKH